MVFGYFDNFIVRSEAEKLAKLTGLRLGFRVAEIGAGSGDFAMFMARLVGEAGEIYATEFDSAKAEGIAKKIKKKNISNLHILPAGAANPNLPNVPFNLIYMRKVYHHFTNPLELNRAFYSLLRPGGKLAVIEFEPKWYLRFSIPKGIPQNRGGHGIPKKVLVDEIVSAGFKQERLVEGWASGGLYCALFQKSDTI